MVGGFKDDHFIFKKTRQIHYFASMAKEEEDSGSSGVFGNTRENTTTVSKKRISPAKRWLFTINNPCKHLGPDGTDGPSEGVDVGTSPEEIMKDLATYFRERSISYIFQYEKGEEGTPHLQGYVESKIRIRPLMKFSDLPKAFSWRLAKGDKRSNIAYCSKEETQVLKPLFSMDLRPPRPVNLIDPNRLWQKEILNIISNDADDRTIHWYWERKGGAGKTSFTKYLVLEHAAALTGGKGADIKNSIIEWKKSHEDPDIVVINLTRSHEEYVSYDGIESVKDMCFYSGKYEGGVVVGNCPHVFVFANFPPDESKLSTDRWRVREIPDESGDTILRKRKFRDFF